MARLLRLGLPRRRRDVERRQHDLSGAPDRGEVRYDRLGAVEAWGVEQCRQVSSYFDRVETGEIFTVTKRGKPVAQVIPASPSPGMASLLAEGRLRWSGASPLCRRRSRFRTRGSQRRNSSVKGAADPVLDTSALIKRFIEEARSTDVPASAAGEAAPLWQPRSPVWRGTRPRADARRRAGTTSCERPRAVRT